MKVELHEGNIVSEENPFYEIGFPDDPNPASRLRVYLDPNLRYRSDQGFFYSNLFAEADLSTINATMDGIPVSHYRLTPPTHPSLNLLTSGRYLGSDYVDLHLSTGNIQLKDNGAFFKIHHQSIYLALLESNQFVASNWIEDSAFGRPKRNIDLNSNGKLKRFQVSEAEWERIVAGDLSALTETPIWTIMVDTKFPFLHKRMGA